jgi:hypothetical protein
MIVRQRDEEAYFLCGLLFVLWWRLYMMMKPRYDSVFEMCLLWMVWWSDRHAKCRTGAFVIWPITDGFMEDLYDCKAQWCGGVFQMWPVIDSLMEGLKLCGTEVLTILFKHNGCWISKKSMAIFASLAQKVNVWRQWRWWGGVWGCNFTMFVLGDKGHSQVIVFFCVLFEFVIW